MATEKAPFTLSRTVVLESGHRIYRRSLPDSHPESWPSRYREATGEEIPEDWQQMLRVPSEQI